MKNSFNKYISVATLICWIIIVIPVIIGREVTKMDYLFTWFISLIYIILNIINQHK